MRVGWGDDNTKPAQCARRAGVAVHEGGQAMNEPMIKRLETSFKMIAPRAPELVDHFFAHLFSRNPALRPLFPRDMSSQKQAFLATFMLIAQNLGRPEKFRQPLIDLGRRHQGYKAPLDHYPAFRDTLIGVMRDMTGPKWSEQLTQDWTDALNFVSALMIEGQKQEEKVRGHAAVGMR